MRANRFAIGAAVALSIVSSSAFAQANAPASAAPLSIAASVQRSAAPAGEAGERSELAGRYGWLLPVVLVTAAIAAVVFLSIDDDPSSP
jgi:hypothetical protein